MIDSRKTTKAEMLAEIDTTWAELNGTLDRLTEEQMTGMRDAQGWTVKDHITHMAAWERSALFFLMGKPRHLGLGVPEELYLNGPDDEINEVIREENKNVPLTAARDNLRRAHQQLLAALAPMSDEDLQKAYSHYLPEEPGEDNGRPASDVVEGNSSRHFAEHLDWIRSLMCVMQDEAEMHCNASLPGMAAI